MTSSTATTASTASTARTLTDRRLRVGIAGLGGFGSLHVGVLAQARSERRTISALGLSDHYKHIFTITRLVDFIQLVDPADLPSGQG